MCADKQRHRHGNSLCSHRIRPDKGQGITIAAYRNPGLPKRRLLARQHDEVPAQLLHQGTTQQDLPVLPRSAFQGSQTQGQNRQHNAKLVSLGKDLWGLGQSEELIWD